MAIILFIEPQVLITDRCRPPSIRRQIGKICVFFLLWYPSLFSSKWIDCVRLCLAISLARMSFQRHWQKVACIATIRWILLWTNLTYERPIHRLFLQFQLMRSTILLWFLMILLSICMDPFVKIVLSIRFRYICLSIHIPEIYLILSTKYVNSGDSNMDRILRW